MPRLIPHNPWWVLACVLWLGACGYQLNYNDDNVNVSVGVGANQTTDNTSPSTNTSTNTTITPEQVTYQVDFIGEWTSSRFPTHFPSNDHFTTFIGATHNSQVKFWNRNKTASAALESVAEIGGTNLMRQEIASAQMAGTADQLISFNGLSSGSGKTSITLVVKKTHALVSLASMLAPSPDWFVGVHDLALYANNTWQARLVVPAKVYDAGTEQGTGFSLSNVETRPHIPISLLTTPAANTDFNVGVHRTSGITVGKFIFTVQ